LRIHNELNSRFFERTITERGYNINLLHYTTKGKGPRFKVGRVVWNKLKTNW
jgi:hypothetical protein